LTYRTRAWYAAPAIALTLAALPWAAQAQTPAAVNHSSTDSDLSASQRARAAARQAQFQKDVAALRTDSKLTDTQKQAKYGVLLQAMDKDMLALLTPAQHVEVQKQRQINAQFQQSITALRTDSKLSNAQKQARYQTLVHNRQTALLATLTPVQRTRVEKEHQSQMTRAAEANRLGAELQKSQTPAQAKQIQAIALATRTQMQAVIADKTMPDSAKSAKITDLRKQAQAKIDALLTPTQRAKYAHLQALLKPPAAPSQ
jgi:hypothetical protein